MSELFEQSVIARLDDLKNDFNRASDRHDAGLKKLFELHEAHVQDDIDQFKSIDSQFTAAAVTAAEVKGAAKATARFWGIALGLPPGLGASIWGAIKFLEHVRHIR